MEQYISKDALVAEIERLKAEALQKKSQCKRSGLEKIMHQIGVYNKILSFLNTLEVKDANEALRTEYEKGRADVIAKACQFLHDYQEYPDHDISPTQLMEAFKDYLSK